MAKKQLTNLLAGTAVAVLGTGVVYSPAQAEQISSGYQTFANEIVIPREGATTFGVRNAQTGRIVARGQAVGSDLRDNNGYLLGSMYHCLPKSQFGTLAGLGNLKNMSEVRRDPFCIFTGGGDGGGVSPQGLGAEAPASEAPSPSPGGGVGDFN